MKSDLNNIQKHNVHKILAHSYFVYFIFFLIGIFFNSVFYIKVFDTSLAASLGFIILILSTFLILWAQKTSRGFQKENINKEAFCRGPYCYTRIPTHLGLFFLMLGFGMIINSFFIILFTLVYFVIAKVVFLKKEEKILAFKYGDPYLEYKKMVKF